MNKLPDQVIVQPHFIALDDERDLTIGHTVKTHSSKPSIFYGEYLKVKHWLEVNGYSKTEELRNRYMAGEIDGIYQAASREDRECSKTYP